MQLMNPSQQAYPTAAGKLRRSKAQGEIQELTKEPGKAGMPSGIRLASRMFV